MKIIIAANNGVLQEQAGTNMNKVKFNLDHYIFYDFPYTRS